MNGTGDELVRRQPHSRDAVAFVTENGDSDDVGRLTGTFRVTLQTDDKVVKGPQEAEVNEAVTWARRRAETVIVRLGHTGRSGPGSAAFIYSAGSKLPVGMETLPWPTTGLVVRGRPVGTVLTGEQQVAEWIIRINLDLTASEPDADVRAYEVLSRTGILAQLKMRSDGPASMLFSAVASAGGVNELSRLTQPILSELASLFDGRLRGLDMGFERAP